MRLLRGGAGTLLVRWTPHQLNQGCSVTLLRGDAAMSATVAAGCCIRVMSGWRGPRALRYLIKSESYAFVSLYRRRSV